MLLGLLTYLRKGIVTNRQIIVLMKLSNFLKGDKSSGSQTNLALRTITSTDCATDLITLLDDRQ
jgi:hypothetical protein